LLTESFFEGDTKLGSKNIPADAVDKIKCLEILVM
jgi:hypothetical protein